MDFSELETAVLALSEADRRALASRLWDSIELSEVAELADECDSREQEADSARDGWTDAGDFLAKLKLRS